MHYSKGDLSKLGIFGISDLHANAILQAMSVALESEVGNRIAADMTERQLEEFQELCDSDRRDAAKQWLNANAPHHPEMVDDVRRQLASRVASHSGLLTFLLGPF